MDLKPTWEAILLALAPEISRPHLITWFQKTALLDFKNGVLTVGVPREFFLSWHMVNAKEKIQAVAGNFLEKVEGVEYVVDGALDHPGDERTVDILALFPSGEMKVRKLPNRAEVKIGADIVSKQITAKYTLQSFVIGPQNRLAHAACQAVAAQPGTTYNPLFIYGGVGLGKTHLLQGAGNEIMAKHPGFVVVYLTAENFVSELVEAIQKRKMDKVREKYRRVDVLILDDVQFLAGKDRSQEIFFHLFNDLYDAGKQIILSSDRPPMELELTEDRLKSRFTMGMIVDVHFPDYETRLAILRNKAQEFGLIIENEVLNFTAYNVHHSVRELEGVLKQIRAEEEFEGVTPTVQSVAKILRKLYKDQDIFGYDEEKEIPGPVKSMDDIVERVADFYQVTKSDVLGKVRNREFVVPRQVAMYLCKKYLKHSLQRIGLFFGNRDHTSVLHSVSQVTKNRKIDPQFWKDVNALQKELGF